MLSVLTYHRVYQEVVSAGGFEASGAVKDDEAEKEDKRSPFSRP